MKTIRLTLYFLFVFSYATAQPTFDYPVIGQPSPDFHLQGIYDYGVSEISISQLKGRHVIIDLWHRHCVTCIASFPKMNALYEQYKAKVDFFLIGMEDKQGLESRYLLAKERYNMTIPWSVDSALYKKLNPGRTAPHLIWIDDQGIVRAVTATITTEQLDKFVVNDSFQFKDVSYQSKIIKNEKSNYTSKLPFMVGGNGGSEHKIRYRSLLLDWVPSKMPTITFPVSIKQAKRWSALSGNKIEGVIDLEQLYRFAYFGLRTWTNAIESDRFGDTSVYRHYYREVQYDISKHDQSYFEVDYSSGKNLYLYSLIYPDDKSEEDYLRDVIKKDLAVNFGFEVVVEDKPMIYWSVQADKESIIRLISQGGEMNRVNHIHLNKQTFVNWPFEKLIEVLFKNVYSRLPPIINETGFSGKIDVNVGDSLLSDFDYIRNTLESNGIYLVLKKKPFKVLTIKPRITW